MAYVGMFAMKPSTKFHVPSFNVSLIMSIKGKSKWRFNAVAILLLYILPTNTSTKVSCFSNSITVHHIKILYYVALMSLPPPRFVRPPCYHRLQEIKRKYDTQVTSNVHNIIFEHPVLLRCHL
jgi:hypothetical protein